MAQLNKFIFGNWKMNMTFNEISIFCKEFNKLIKRDKILKQTNIQYGVAPTYLGIIPTTGKIIKSAIVGAQNCSEKENGAFTSQISYSQLKEFNIKHIILGHSEVRQYLHETNAIINAKALKLLEQSMVPIICIGETLKEYESKKTINVLEKQILEDCKGMKPSDASNVIIAYEPIWAIGTGKTPTNVEIEKVCTSIRKILRSIFKKEADKVHILYGGSLKPENAINILELNNVDGGLIGGASMKAESFYKMITACPQYIKLAKRGNNE